MSDLCVQEHICQACDGKGKGCAACEGEGRIERRAAFGLRLCHSCRRYMAKLIDQLPHRYADLEDRLSVTGTGGDRVSGSSSTPLPINTAVAGVRYDIQHALVSWALFVADARGLKALPDGDEPRLTAPWLARHCDWLAADPVGAEECLPTMRLLTGSAWRLIDPDGRKRIKVGPCTQTTKSGPCGGVLYATVRAEDDTRPSAITCDVCEFELAPSSWLKFGRTYQRQATLKEEVI